MHTKKMILVPHDISHTNKPVDRIIEDLEDDLKHIMLNKNTATDVKLSRYNQTLQRYNNMMHKKQKPYELLVNEESDSMFSDELILDGIPQKQVQNATLLLQHVHTNPNVKINDAGEVIIDGNTIHGSNIVDLIHDFSRESKVRHPAVGAEAFAKVLKRANLPSERIGNKKRLRLFDVADWDE